MNRTRAWLFMSCASVLALGGCNIGEEVGQAVGDAFANSFCGFRFSSDERLIGDNGMLEGSTSCGDVLDCSDRRTVLHGVTMDLGVRLTPLADEHNVRIESSDDSVLEIDGFEPRYDGCDRVFVADGTIHFVGVGKASVIVYVNDFEIDRFTWTSFDADSIELRLNPEVVLYSDAPGWKSKTKYTLDNQFVVEAQVRNADGERLLSAGTIQWWVDDGDVLDIGGDGVTTWGRGALVTPIATGTTQLHVVAWNLEDSVEITVPEGFVPIELRPEPGPEASP